MEPIVTGFGIIDQVEFRAIIEGSHTQSIVQGGYRPLETFCVKIVMYTEED